METSSAPQLELGYHGNAEVEGGAAGAGQLELVFLGNAEADGNHGKANVNRQIILSYPTYSTGRSYYPSQLIQQTDHTILPNVFKRRLVPISHNAILF